MAVTALLNLIVDSSKAVRGFFNFSKSAEKAEKKTGDFQKQVRNAATSVSLIQGPLNGIAARFINLSQLIGRGVTPAMIGFTAAISAGVISVFKSISAFADYEKRLNRLQGVLNATGNSVGFSAVELDKFALQLGKNTLTSRQAVLDAAASLTTFRSIAGQTFLRTLKLAQDVSEVFGQDLKTSTVQLAKALEDPIRGLTSLRRTGIIFSAEQEKVIKQFVRTGRVAAAQGVILDEVARQLGGSAVKAAEGLAGNLDTLGESWSKLLVNIGGSLAPAVKNVVGFFDGILNGIKNVELAVNSAVFDFKPVVIDPDEIDVESLTKKLNTVRKSLQDAQVRVLEANNAFERLRASGAVEAASRQFLYLTDRIKELNDEDAAKQAKAIEEAQKNLTRSLQVSTQEIRAQGVELGVLIKEGFSLAEAQEIQNLARKKGTDIFNEQIRSFVFANRAYKEYTEQVKRDEEEQAKANEAASNRISVINEQLALLEQLNDAGASQLEIETTLNANRTLGNKASKESVELLAERTRLLKEETAAAQERARVAQEQKDIGENLESLRDQVKALEEVGAESEEFNKILERQRVQQSLGKSATEEQITEYVKLQERLKELKEANKQAFDPRPLEIFAKSALQVSRNSEQAFVNFATSASEELAKFVTGAETNFRRLFASLIQQLIQVQIQAAIAKSVGGGGILGSLVSGIGGIFAGGAASAAPSPIAVQTPIPSNSSQLFSPAPFADGGPFKAGQTMLVGERGPEIVQFGSSGTVFPTGTGPSGGVSVAQTLNFQGFSGEQRDARIIGEAVNRATASAVNEVLRLSQSGGRESKIIRGS